VSTEQNAGEPVFEDAAARRARALHAYLDCLHDAVCVRDIDGVRRLLELPLSSRLPRQVIEEALSMLREPAGSFRAPIELLRFYHRTRQLTEETAPDGDVMQLTLGLPRTVPAEETPSSWRPSARPGRWQRRPGE
jgi:hypothetical protein